MTMHNFDPNKTYSIGVCDVTYYVYDEEAGVAVCNEDGSVKIFHAPNMDYSYMTEDLDVDDLEENVE